MSWGQSLFETTVRALSGPFGTARRPRTHDRRFVPRVFVLAVVLMSCQSALAEDVISAPLQVYGMGPVYSVAYSPDGLRVLTGAADNTAKLWDANTGTLTRTFTGHTNLVTSVAFSPDGTRVLTGSWDTTARLWNAETGALVRTFSSNVSIITSVAFSPDGTRVLAGGGFGLGNLWNADTGALLRSFWWNPSTSISSVAFSPDGERVLTGFSDNMAILWDANTGELLRTFASHTAAVWSVAFSPDGLRVLTGSGDGTAKLWDADTGGLLRTFASHTAAVWSVAFSPDGLRVLTGSGDGTAKLWDVDTGTHLLTFTGHAATVRSVAFSPDGLRVLTGSWDRTARLWDADSGILFREFSGHTSSITSVAFSPDGSQVLTGSADYTAKLWDTGTGVTIRTFAGHTDFVRSVAFSPDGSRVLTGSWDGTAKLWDANTGEVIRTFTGHTDAVTSVAFSPDGLRVLTGSFDNTADLWDANTGSDLLTFSGHTDTVMSVTFSPDGLRALTGSIDGTAKLWDSNTGAVVRTFTGHTDSVNSVAYSPDGSQVLTGSWDGTAKLWGANTGEVIRNFTGHTSGVLSVAFSPDMDLVLTSSADTTAKLWNAETGVSLRAFTGHSSYVYSVTSSPDGLLVLTGSSDDTAKLWDSGKKLIVSPRRAGSIAQGDSLRFSAVQQIGLYAWDFGDGRSSSQQTPGIVSFPSSGDHNVELTITDGEPKIGDKRDISVVENAGALGDFDVSAVTISADLAVGQTADVAYTVRNVGPAAVPDGSWKDSIYLSTDPYLDINDTLLTSATMSGGLAHAGSYQNSLPVTLPIVSEGAYYLIVSIDDEWQILEQHQLNNEYAESLEVMLPALQDGVLWQGSFAIGNVSQLFRMEVVDTQVLQLLVQGLPPGVEVYLRYGLPATQGTYDYRVDGTELTIPSATSGTWYLLVVGNSIPTSGQYTIQFNLSSLSISSVSPGQVAFGSPIDLVITGAGFAPGTQAQLLGTNKQTIGAETVNVDSYARLTAHFTAGAVPAGNYGLRVIGAAGSDDRTVALRVIESGEAHLETRIIMPAQLGRHAAATIYIEYENTGNVPMPAPLLVMGAADPNSTNQPILTLDSKRVTGGLWTDLLVFQSTNGPHGFSTRVQFLANGNLPGTLQPGESRRIPVYYVGILKPWDFANSQIELGITVIEATDASVVDWNTYKSDMRPFNVSEQAWEAVWANFTVHAGSTWGEYVSLLDRYSAYLGSVGQQTQDVEELLGLILKLSDGHGLLDTLAKSTDLIIEAPGLPIELIRTYPESISDRYAVGPFGRGWFHNWQYRLTTDSDGTISIISPRGGRRIFQPDLRSPNAYISRPYDNGNLVLDNAGSYLLTEDSGTTFTFSPDGMLTRVSDLNGNHIQCRYTNGELNSLEHSSGRFLQLEYSPAGRILQVIDDQGRKAFYSYSPDGEYLKGALLNDRRSLTYEYATDTDPTRQHALLEVSDSGNVISAYAYDARGRVSSSGCDCTGGIDTYTYDGLATVQLHRAAGAVSTYSFEMNGKVGRSVSSSGQVIFTRYNSSGYPESVETTDGKSIQFAYDRYGYPVRIVDTLRNRTDFRYQYKPTRLTGVIDAFNRTTRYSYDNRANVASITYADNSKESWIRNGSGLPVGSVNRRNQLTQYEFNGDGNLLHTLHPDGADYTYSYDQRNNLTNAAGPEGAIGFVYSDDDFLTHIDYPGGRWLEFEYDDQGRRVSVIDQHGNTENYAYDAEARLDRITDADGLLVTRYEYDDIGRPIREIFGNGVSTNIGYDASNRVTSVSTVDANSTVLSSFHVEFGPGGLPLALNTHYGVWHYSYDLASRLTDATFESIVDGLSGVSLAYKYDALGNRTEASVDGVPTKYSLGPLNRYTAVGAATYSYDADGNMIVRNGPDGTHSFAFDSKNRITSASVDGSIIQYNYGPMGDIVASTKDGERTEFVNDYTAGGRRVGEYSHTGEIRYFHEYAASLVSRLTDSGAREYYSIDGKGNISTVTDANGSVVNAYAYSPWGLLKVTEGTANDWEFAADFGGFNAIHDYVAMGARWFSPEIGRFISEDPLGVSATGPNQYLYGWNDPISWVDATGEQPRPGRPIRLGPTRTPRTRWQPPPVRVENQLPKVQTPWIADLIEKLSDLLGSSAQQEQNYIFDCSNRVASACNGYPGQEVLFENCNGVGQVLRCPQATQESPPPVPENSVGTKGQTGVAGSVDPNQKIGPNGYGPSGYISAGSMLPYRVEFENDPDASAPAQVITISDHLSTSTEWGSFEVTEIGFGDVMVEVPQGLQHFETSVPYSYNDVNFEVQIETGIRLATGEVYANFYTIVPEIGLPPTVDIGFLPPEDGTGRGQGHFSYIVQHKPGLPSGTEIRNVATIQFDFGKTIATNQVDPHDPGQGTDPNKEALVTIDAGAPTGSVSPLPEVTSSADFEVSWSGSDDNGGSGIRGYDIYVRDGNGAWVLWLQGTSDTSAVFHGENGHTYEFYAVAIDNTGNRQAAPAQPDAVTRVDIQTGSVRVTIKPNAAVQAGARWRVDGGAWHENGTVVNGLAPGLHQVTFLPVLGWKTPKAVSASVIVGSATERSAKYKAAKLKVKVPNGGEAWTRNERNKVKWSSKGETGKKVRLELWLKGELLNVVSESTANDGKYKWKIPSALDSGSGYKIRIEAIEVPGLADLSNKSFSVVAGKITDVMSGTDSLSMR